MWCYRRMMKIPWAVRKTNDEVLKQTCTQRNLIIRIRQSRFFRHIMQRKSLEHLVTKGKIQGR
uniref:Myosin motor domain-containing protein n=1 Tax=Arion vulgaris TaxID=1028688 RepID=A0A0B6ZY04_9EUPU